MRNTARCKIDWPELGPGHQTLIGEGFVGCNGDQKIRRSVSNPKLPLPCQIWEILHAAELIGPDRRPSDFDWVRQGTGGCNAMGIKRSGGQSRARLPKLRSIWKQDSLIALQSIFEIGKQPQFWECFGWVSTRDTQRENLNFRIFGNYFKIWSAM